MKQQNPCDRTQHRRHHLQAQTKRGKWGQAQTPFTT